MVLRDVIERHNVTNVRALRWLQRHLLAAPGGSVSVNKLYDDLKSQGIGVGKDNVYADVQPTKSLSGGYRSDLDL